MWGVGIQRVNFWQKSSISIDHINRKADGGSGSSDNAQLTHPYCNSTIKN